MNVWLNNNPNYQEIQQWYSGWRSLLPPGMINHTIIKEKLTEALMIVDHHLSCPLSVQPTQLSTPFQPINPKNKVRFLLFYFE